MKAIRIAIDGPASSGKGTLARRVAVELGYTYLDTGAMYRAIGLLALEQGLELSQAGPVTELAGRVEFQILWQGGLLQIRADGRDLTASIRAERAGRAASDVAVHAGVRSALVSQQQRMAVGEGIVMDGRDIGTVVLPRAELKIFLDASAVERARRRAQELRDRGLKVNPQAVLEQILHRDLQDSNRDASPLRAARDALRLDSTAMSSDEVCRQVVSLARERLAQME